MAGLEGTVTTPFGAVSKKTALLVGGGAVIILGYSYFRAKKLSAANAAAQAGANTGIDPATGYAYGSAEDAAALAAQGAYVTPTGGGGGGVASGAYPAGGFTTNSQWVQAVVTQFQSSNPGGDPNAMLAALGNYISGDPAASDQKGLIEQAIALEGYPPVAGPNGYPPHINTANVVTPPPTSTTPGDGRDTRPGVWVSTSGSGAHHTLPGIAHDAYGPGESPAAWWIIYNANTPDHVRPDGTKGMLTSSMANNLPAGLRLFIPTSGF